MRVCKKLGYDGYTNPHSLRHAAITQAQRLNGVILIDVKHYFGHARSSDVTERYTHSDMTQLRPIAEGLSNLILGTA